MKIEKSIPGAKRLIESLCDLGYETHTAIADLIDNSIVANASNIHVDIDFDPNGKPFVVIADDGSGMTKEDLSKAMRFGSFQHYDKNALGKYGLGLKTASLSQCRCLTVITRPTTSHAKTSIARWDLEFIDKKDEWHLLLLNLSDLEKWENDVVSKFLNKGTGTVVIWSLLREGFNPLLAKDQNTRDEFQAKVMKDITAHIAMVFHQFMDGDDKRRKRPKLFVGGTTVESLDPFCKKEPKTLDLDVKTYEIEHKGKTYDVNVRPYIIPREDEFSSPAARDKAKGKNFNGRQGFYFYRNGRLLKMGGWNRMRSNDEHTKLVRVAIDFPSSLDELFSINITKMTAKIPNEIYSSLAKDSAAWVTEGRKRYDKKSKKSSGKPSSKRTVAEPSFVPKDYKFGRYTLTPASTPGKNSIISTSKTSDKVTIAVPTRSALYPLLSGGNSVNSELKNLTLVLLAYLEGIRDGKIKVKDVPFDYLVKQAKDLA